MLSAGPMQYLPIAANPLLLTRMTMCYNLLGAMLPSRWQTYNSTCQPSTIYSEIPQKNINLFLFTFGDFYYEKIHRRPTKIPCYSWELPTLAWGQYIGIAGEKAGAKKSLSHQEHPGIHFWQLGEAHASQLDSHFPAPTTSSTRSGFFFPKHLSLALNIKSDFRAQALAPAPVNKV